MLAASGCSGDVAVAPPPATDVGQLFWSLTLDPHAVTISTAAPFDTMKIVATPRTIDGEPLSGLPTPIFTSGDLERVQVSAEGVVQAIAPGNEIKVVATLAQGNLVHADTVLVTVTSSANPPVLDSLSFGLSATDSAKVALPASKLLTVTAWDTSAVAIVGLPIHYTSSDPTTATIRMIGTRAMVQPVRPGPVAIIATTTAYGITKADTLPFTIGQPLSGNIAIVQQLDASGKMRNVFAPERIVVGTGSDITWYNETGIATDVTFDDPADIVAREFYCRRFYTDKEPALCADGNIEAFGMPAVINGVPDTLAAYHNKRARHFPVPGTYTFQSVSSGATGTIVVVDESRP
jgi:plastocyanin